MRYSKRKSHISKKSNTRKIGGTIFYTKPSELDISDILKQYKLTKKQKYTIHKNIQKLFIKFNKYMNNDKYISEYFRQPINKMWYLIHQFLTTEQDTSSLSQQDIYNLTHDLYDKFLAILMKESLQFRSPKSSSIDDNTDNESQHSYMSSNNGSQCITKSEVIRFRKIHIDEVPEGTAEVYILDI
jgi:hypothetical protein